MKGPPAHRNIAFQQQKIDLLKIDLERLFRNNIGTIVQVDEVVFSPNEKRQFRTWAYKGNPIQLSSRDDGTCDLKWQCAVAAVSSDLGLVHAKFPPQATAVNSRIYCDFIDEVVAKVGYPLTIFTDNLSAHNSKYTRDYLYVTHPQVGHIFNVPYRPDLNGIENYWQPLKTEYRKRVCNFKANTACFSNRDLVQ